MNDIFSFEILNINDHTVMPLQKKVVFLLGLLFLIAVLVVIIFVERNSRLSIEDAPAVITTPSHTNISDEAIINQLRLLQAKENEVNQTVWSQEMLAQEYEQFFINMWDQMRSSTNKISVIANIPFDEISFKEPGTTLQHQHSIRETRFDGIEKRLQMNEWIELINRIHNSGFQIEQSEWRQTQFDSNSGIGAPRSTFRVNIHGRNANLNQRYILVGDIEIFWKSQSNEQSSPEISNVNVTHLTLKNREDRPVFRSAMRSVLPPTPPLDRLQPFILVYDLNEDGLSEILLPTRNLVLRNLGNTRFKAEPLINNRGETILTASIADFTGDGNPDLLGTDPEGLILWQGDGGDGFVESPARVWTTGEEPLFNPYGVSVGDIDGDQDLDLWIGQYKIPYIEGQMPTPFYDANDGFLSYILINDGKGIFEDITEKSGIEDKRRRRIFSGSFIDLDKDNDLDLVTMSDFSGIDLFVNDGTGYFSDITDQAVDERHLFGMANSFGDFNLDGVMDIFAVGMTSSIAERLDYMGLERSENQGYQKMREIMTFGNRLYFGSGRRFVQTEMSHQVRDAGWAWGSAAFDFDNDGDEDIYVANGHITRSSARDYEADFWLNDIYLANSDTDPVVDLYFRSRVQQIHSAGYSSGGNFRNNLFINEGGKSFFEAAYLFDIAFPRDYRHAISEDLDGDGQKDLILTIVEEWPRLKQELHILHNVQASTGNWIGFRLDENNPGKSPIGVTIRIESGGINQMRQIVAGDSYRTQNSFSAQFGLGDSDSPVQGKIVWPDGTEKNIQNLPLNSWYLLTP